MHIVNIDDIAYLHCILILYVSCCVKLMHYFNYIGCKDAKDIKEESKLLITTVIIMQNIIEIMLLY